MPIRKKSGNLYAPRACVCVCVYIYIYIYIYIYKKNSLSEFLRRGLMYIILVVIFRTVVLIFIVVS